MKILHLRAENFKKLSVVEIIPDRDIIHITGANGSGKSTVLDVIETAIMGGKAMPKKPIRTGATEAVIHLDLGDVTITRKFVEGKKPSLVVAGKDGGHFPSPQAMLEELLGNAGVISFDPMAFARMKPADQLEALRSVVKIDVDLDAMQRLTDTDYSERTMVNRALKEKMALLSVAGKPSQFAGLPMSPVDEKELIEQLGGVSQRNSAIQQEMDKRASQDRTAADIRAQMAELQSRLEAYGEMVQMREELGVLEDSTEIKDKINEARAINKRIAERTAFVKLEKDVKLLTDESNTITERMDARTAERAAAIAAVKMPVDGLTFGDGELLLNGEPFEQASTAQKIRVGCAIAMQAGSKVNVLRILDGEKLDPESYKLLTELVLSQGWQCWIEQVSNGPVGIELEDGAVIRVDGELVPQEADSVD